MAGTDLDNALALAHVCCRRHIHRHMCQGVRLRSVHGVGALAVHAPLCHPEGGINVLYYYYYYYCWTETTQSKHSKAVICSRQILRNLEHQTFWSDQTLNTLQFKWIFKIIEIKRGSAVIRHTSISSSLNYINYSSCTRQVEKISRHLDNAQLGCDSTRSPSRRCRNTSGSVALLPVITPSLATSCSMWHGITCWHACHSHTTRHA